ncbi:branched-chain amino acid aminotransferase [Actinokineospora sp. NBRC 105648]|uniref:branched-chain amino acid aminotransferase n=1 Tax=Actinokineospora sp. NBRC 105648 TaxID=3032206 RepID=UPI0024A02E43|nr:branched-chain amino acid aminotransferase [Actinokineospora sp. NBRC 105648]GLZ37993.1 branched-chain-amino-acid aminotransferase [Actinokineospora sp. NBRC 105648]
MTLELTAPTPTRPGHGDAFTDHMVTMAWNPLDGWHDRRVGPLAALPLHPATIGLHYAQVIFEGLKAHRQADGSVAVFRPDRNATRFRASARRLEMPELPEEAFLSAVDDLVALDQHLLSDDPELSIYLRPLMFATEPNLMLRPSGEYLFLLMAFVAGGFFGADAFAPVSVLIGRTHTRAVPGGTGDVKCAANYGPSFVAQRLAQEAGCQQVVWLDAIERRWVEEMGGMNMFFVRAGESGPEVFTPALTGTLLPGVTRDSLLTLAAQLGYPVSEERISVDQWRQDCVDGRITEVFACGTAAVVTPVGRVHDGDDHWLIGDGTAGPVTTALRKALVDVQHGLAPAPRGWLRPIPAR